MSAAKANTPPERIDLGGGALAFVESSHAIPLVSIVVSFRSGAAHDPPGKEGLSRLTARMLRRGAANLTGPEIEDAIDRLGGEIAADVSTSTMSVHAQVIRRNLEPFIELLTKVISSPIFPEDELERLKRETVAEIIEARDSDRALAQVAFRRALFGAHAYGRGTGGTTKTVPTLTRDDVRASYAKHFVRGNAVVGFSGDIDIATAKACGEKIVNGLRGGAALPDVITAPNPPPKGRRLVFVDKPERTQTQILIGGLGTAPFDPDHVALGVANGIFGGTFTSRLMREVRSKRGWSYGASARLAVDRQRQSFSMWTFPAATDAAACIALELDLLEAYVKSGVTPREVAFIKKYLTRSHAFDVDTAQKRLHQALDVELLGLPADYYSGYVANVAKVTAEAANEAVRARIATDDLLIVVVGTASELLDAVKGKIPALADEKVVPFDQE